MPEKMLDLEQLLSIPHVDSDYGFDISPDGSRVAFSWNRDGQWEIFETSLKKPDQFVQISQGPGAKFAPQYSPDAGSLLYLVDLDGSEEFDIYQYDFHRQIHVNMTPNSEYAILPGAKYSHDGKLIAFQSDRSGVFDTYLIPAEGGNHELVFSCEMPNTALYWSPNDQSILVTVSAKGQETWACLIDISDRCHEWIHWADRELDVQGACWAPDDPRIVFSAARDEFYEIGIYNCVDKTFNWIEQDQGDKVWPDWSSDGKSLAFITMFGPETWVTHLRLSDHIIEKFQVEQGVHFAPLFFPDGNALIVPFDNYSHPTDLWLLNLQENKFSQLTHSLPNAFTSSDFFKPEHIWYPGMDGTLIPAWIYTPRKNTQELPPAVIVPHGGPSWLFQNLWYPIFQHMAHRGWLVVTPNYRGSTGYGRSWQLANQFKLGSIDTQDVVASRDYLVQTSLADPDRIVITGRSHGGYLTMTCLTQYPERFAGGSAVVPFLNWFTSHEKIRADLKHWDLENMGNPVENYARWYNASPYFFLEKLQSPVQLICGAHDPRCPAEDSIAAYERLLSFGKKVELLIYDDEGHAFLKIENVIDHELRRIEFLANLIES